MRDYVARLGIARPRVDDLVGRRDIKLFDLMVAALLEHGGPTSTTGIGRPLGDAARMRAHLAARDQTRLRRRVEADLEALYALYRYGVLHRYVRLRWGSSTSCSTSTGR